MEFLIIAKRSKKVTKRKFPNEQGFHPNQSPFSKLRKDRSANFVRHTIWCHGFSFRYNGRKIIVTIFMISLLNNYIFLSGHNSQWAQRRETNSVCRVTINGLSAHLLMYNANQIVLSYQCTIEFTLNFRQMEIGTNLYNLSRYLILAN